VLVRHENCLHQNFLLPTQSLFIAHTKIFLIALTEKPTPKLIIVSIETLFIPCTLTHFIASTKNLFKRMH
jgi:hypothetical protein